MTVTLDCQSHSTDFCSKKISRVIMTSCCWIGSWQWSDHDKLVDWFFGFLLNKNHTNKNTRTKITQIPTHPRMEKVSREFSHNWTNSFLQQQDENLIEYVLYRISSMKNFNSKHSRKTSFTEHTPTKPTEHIILLYLSTTHKYNYKKTEDVLTCLGQKRVEKLSSELRGGTVEDAKHREKLKMFNQGFPLNKKTTQKSHDN